MRCDISSAAMVAAVSRSAMSVSAAWTRASSRALIPALIKLSAAVAPVSAEAISNVMGRHAWLWLKRPTVADWSTHQGFLGWSRRIGAGFDGEGAVT